MHRCHLIANYMLAAVGYVARGADWPTPRASDRLPISANPAAFQNAIRHAQVAEQWLPNRGANLQLKIIALLPADPDEALIEANQLMRNPLIEKRDKFWAAVALEDHAQANDKNGEAAQNYWKSAFGYDQLLALGDSNVTKLMHAPAIRWYQRAASIHSDSGLWLKIGKSYLEINEFDKARMAFENAAAVNPQSRESWYALGSALRETRAIEQALAAYQRALLATDNSVGESTILYAIGWTHVYSETPPNIAAALDVFTQAGQKNDYAGWGLGEAETLFQMGHLQMAYGRVEHAIDCYRAAVKLAPQSASFNTSLGFALAAAGDEGEALSTLLYAVKLDPGNVDAWRTLGNLYKTRSEVLKAREAYMQVLRISPDDPEAKVVLSKLP